MVEPSWEATKASTKSCHVCRERTYALTWAFRSRLTQTYELNQQCLPDSASVRALYKVSISCSPPTPLYSNLLQINYLKWHSPEPWLCPPFQNLRTSIGCLSWAAWRNTLTNVHMSDFRVPSILRTNVKCDSSMSFESSATRSYVSEGLRKFIAIAACV
jgi:hypothetical protein